MFALETDIVLRYVNSTGTIQERIAGVVKCEESILVKFLWNLFRKSG